MAQAEPQSYPLPAAADLRSLLAAPPPVLDFVLPGLKRGTVGGLVSPGGLGKSYWAIGLALSLAQKNGADLTGLKPAHGRVLLLAAEDPADVLTQRLQAYKPMLPLKSNLDAMDVRCLAGYRPEPTATGAIQQLDLLNEAVYAAIAGAAAGYRLIVLDTLTRFHNLDENSAPDMKRLLEQLERLAAETGAAVLFLHHTSKSSILNGQGTLQQAARGSSVLTDNARWVAFLAPMSALEARSYGVAETEVANYVRFNISKQNYGAARTDQWYRREAGGALQPVELARRPKATEPRQAVQAAAAPAPGTDPQPHNEIAPRPTATGAHGGKW